MESLSDKIVTRLFAKFAIIYGKKWTSVFDEDEDGELHRLYLDEWGSGLRGINVNEMAEALDQCKLSLAWPPSIAEFRKLCEKNSGMKTPKEIMQTAIQRDFSDPIVEKVYKKIGSWAFTHDSEKELLAKIKEVLPDCMTEIRRENVIELPKRNQSLE